jgi:glycosyltransferase involved in cell wall biosynthesis
MVFVHLAPSAPMNTMDRSFPMCPSGFSSQHRGSSSAPESAARALILIPAYNAGPELDALLSELTRYHPKSHILVIDDGSATTSYETLKASGFTVLRFPHGGKGSALKHGFQEAISRGYDWVITMDADGQHAPEDLPCFLDFIQQSSAPDIILGNRLGDVRTMPFLRKLTNFVCTTIIRWATRQPVIDSQSGYRAIRTAVLQEVRLKTAGFETEIELLLKAARQGFRIGSVPVRTIYVDVPSHIKRARDTYGFIRIVARHLLHLDD